MQCVLAPPIQVSVSNTNLLDIWFFRLLANLIGYATIAVPAFLIIKHLRKIKYNEKGKSSLPDLSI